MAHIGSFIPCSRAVISLTDHFFARISTVETCAVPQNSFQLDLTQMATILRRTSSRSLGLIDEFGKGTSPAFLLSQFSLRRSKHCPSSNPKSFAPPTFSKSSLWVSFTTGPTESRPSCLCRLDRDKNRRAIGRQTGKRSMLVVPKQALEGANSLMRAAGYEPAL
jgi:hypothetical protein